MIVDEDEAESEKETPVVQENITEAVREETSQNKRKKRKVVDRTVMSEDGYIGESGKCHLKFWGRELVP